MEQQHSWTGQIQNEHQSSDEVIKFCIFFRTIFWFVSTLIPYAIETSKIGDRWDSVVFMDIKLPSSFIMRRKTLEGKTCSRKLTIDKKLKTNFNNATMAT